MKQTKNHRPRAVIFDMDGLMLDTERPLIPLWVEAGKPFSGNITEELAIRTIGLNSVDIEALVMRELGEDFPYDAFRAELRRLVNIEFSGGIRRKPGLLSLLDHLMSRGIPLAVATSSSNATAMLRLDQAAIAGRFAAIVCGNEVSRGKPFPDIFLRAAEKLNIPPASCAGFEDSPAGLKALAAAGIPSVFVKDIIEPPEEILATVWKRFDRLDEAISLFE